MLLLLHKSQLSPENFCTYELGAALMIQLMVIEVTSFHLLSLLNSPKLTEPSTDMFSLS